MTDNFLALKGLTSRFIPISRFNRGEASQIFEEVSASGSKVVLKNNMPVGVIITPERYDELMELLEDLLLHLEADQRTASASASPIHSEAQVMESLGIRESDLIADDVEIE